MSFPGRQGMMRVAGIIGMIILMALMTAGHSYAWQLLPNRALFTYPGIDGVGYITTQASPGIGRVVTTLAEKGNLIGENEVIYLDVGAGQGIREGDRLLAFSYSHPRELHRYRIKIHEGILRVLEVGENESAALVEEAFISISPGSWVGPFRPRSPEIKLKPAPQYMEGRIIWPYEGSITFGEGDPVFIDRGATDGVQVGQCYMIYRVPMAGYKAQPKPQRKWYQRAPGGKHLITGIGEMIVIDVQEATATALITSSLLPMEAGERFRAGCALEQTLAELAKAKAPVVPAPPPKPPEAPSEAEKEAAMAAFENVDVQFAFDSYALSDRSKGILREKADFLQTNREIRVLIEGHCDERGTEQYNLALGDRRANSARQFLMGLGVDGERMRTVSYGEERPLDPGHNEGAWARNRRAHFVIQ
jgi:peptidoglycan-associated lipoprotein